LVPYFWKTTPIVISQAVLNPVADQGSGLIDWTNVDLKTSSQPPNDSGQGPGGGTPGGAGFINGGGCSLQVRE